MNLSRARPARGAKPIREASQQIKSTGRPKLKDMLHSRDYTGAIALLEFHKKTYNSSDGASPAALEAIEQDVDPLLIDAYIGYACFHLGDYKKAMEVYQGILQDTSADTIYHVYLACCYFYLGMYTEAEEEALKGPSTPLQNRILFHVSHKATDESKLMVRHQKLQDTIEDQLCLASIHYMRGHYQAAVDIYKSILLENRSYLALNVYIALCYYKLDYFDVSLEILNVYLQAHPDSAVAINLKACNHYRLYNGKAAEMELKPILDIQGISQSYENDLVKHNQCIFRSGVDAMKILPPLLDIVPEARLNLAVYHLRNFDYEEAYKLVNDIEPSTTQEYISKAVVFSLIGQDSDNQEYLKLAQQYFQVVGSSPTEKDTIPGRQCMAACFFLARQFTDSLVYFKSIKSYLYNDDDFNHNYGLALLATENYKEAEETLQQVRSEELRSSYSFLSGMARCMIMNGNARGAWEAYLTMETSNDSFLLLQLIANDCYKSSAFYYAAKAFDVLERLDGNPEFWEGKRGACAGVFQQIVSGRELKSLIREVVQMLLNSQNAEAEYMSSVMVRWAQRAGMQI